MADINFNEQALKHARRGELENLKALHSSGHLGDLEITDNKSKETLLMKASKYGHADTVEWLLSTGAQAHAINVRGYTALELVMVNKDVTDDAALKVVNTFLLNGDDAQVGECLNYINTTPQQDNAYQKLEGYTLFMFAAAIRPPKWNTLRALLKKQKNPDYINAVAKNGMNLLLLVLENEDPESIDFDLVDMITGLGGDPLAKLKDGRSALDLLKGYANSSHPFAGRANESLLRLQGARTRQANLNETFRTDLDVSRRDEHAAAAATPARARAGTPPNGGRARIFTAAGIAPNQAVDNSATTAQQPVANAETPLLPETADKESGGCCVLL